MRSTVPILPTERWLSRCSGVMRNSADRKLKSGIISNEIARKSSARSLRIYSIRAALMRTAKYQLLHFFLHNRSLANPTVSDVIVGCSKSTKIRVRYIVALPDFFLLSRGFLWFEPSQRTEDSCPAVAGGLAHVFNRRL